VNVYFNHFHINEKNYKKNFLYLKIDSKVADSDRMQCREHYLEVVPEVPFSSVECVRRPF
jgi:hypothetical protein